MLTGAAPIRASKRKFVVRAKPSSGSTNSSPGDLPSRREVNLPELFAHPEMHTRSDDPAGTTEGASSNFKSNDEIQAIPDRTPSHKFEAELASHSFPKEEESERKDSTGPFEYATIHNSEDDATVVEKSHSRALRQSDVADIEKKLKRMLQVHGPSDQGELLKALSPSQSQDVIQLYGTLTAFIEQLPGFILVHEDPYTFVYYEEPDGEEYDRGESSDLQDEADAGACSTASDDGGGRQLTVSDDCELQRARSSSSSSSCYESAVEEQHEEEEKRGLKDASCQVSSPPCCHSRGLQAVQETSDAEAQTNELDTSPSLELKSTPQGVGADVAQMKERLENLRQNQVGEVQQLKTEQLLKSPQAATPQYVVKLKNRTATKEQKAVDKNRAGDEVSPPQPRLPLRQRNLPPRLRPGNKLLMPPVEPRSWPLKQIDEQFSRAAKPQFHEVPDSKEAATPSTDVEYTRSSQRQIVKGKTDKQISKLVRIVKKKQPEVPDHEIRIKIDRLRRSLGGLSGMTFSAIVELLLGKAQAEPEVKH